MATETEDKQDEKEGDPADRSTATWIRRTRAQILRRAAGLTLDPAQSGAERNLLLSAQHLQNAGDCLAEAKE